MTKFVVVSDFHYALDRYLDEETRKGRKLMQYAEPLLERFAFEMNRVVMPDFVVNLGDLIQDYGDYEEDVEVLKSFWKSFEQIRGPVYTCVGNHDLRATKNREAVAAALGYENTTYSVDVSGVHLVVLGTDVNYKASTADGVTFEQHRISDADLKWLEEDLKRTELPVILCLHFGVAEDLQEGNYWFEACPEEGLISNRKELKKILKCSGKVRGVFSGHQHWTKTLVEDQIPYYLVGSMTENFHGDGIPDGVYLTVTLDEHTLKVSTKYIRL